MKKYSISYVIKEMQIKATVRYHSHLSEWPKSRTLTPSTGKEEEQQSSHSLLLGIQNGTDTLEHSLEVPYKTKLR